MIQGFILYLVLTCCALVKGASNAGPYLDKTFFMSLENYQINAKEVPESLYPWIARVVHSVTENLPHVCTAVCVEDRIFITAARCIYSLKIDYTRVIHQYNKLVVLAFVLPSKPSKQFYDDIGFIVVEPRTNYIWNKVALYDKKRTDNAFQWFADTKFDNYTVVGYAIQKGNHRIKSADRQFDLTELPITINIEICAKIMTFFHHIDGFRVPCYHSCDIHPKCSNYHGVEGGAVVHKSGTLLGLATWGAYFPKYELPVGFSVVNSDNFYEDFECAKRIKNSEVMNGSYRGICDN